MLISSSEITFRKRNFQKMFVGVYDRTLRSRNQQRLVFGPVLELTFALLKNCEQAANIDVE